MNQLQDVTIGRALVAASQAGVPVDLIIRGFCCLLPGVPGATDNIRVRSVIGRFLEHSRIFHFANGNADPRDGDYYIGSADWMYRNLTRRVEAVTPIADKMLIGSALALVIPSAILGVLLERLVLGPALSRLAINYAVLPLAADGLEIAVTVAGLLAAAAIAVAWVGRQAVRESVLSGLAS